MGRKVHPVGFRIGGVKDWQAKWYASKHYAEFLHEDLKLRNAIQSEYSATGISLVQIDRQANTVSVTIHTSRPGVVIGRGGQRVDKMRQRLESLLGKRIQLNIQEIQQPELDAFLVARVIADQIGGRIAYRRAMKQAISRSIMAGAKGIRIRCAGRLGGAEIARSQTMHEGRVPLHTLRADIDYGVTEARTALGRIGVKVWIYKGDILPEQALPEFEEAPPELSTTGTAAEPAVIEGAEAPAEAVPAVTVEAPPEPVTAEAPAVIAAETKAEEKPVKPKTRTRKAPEVAVAVPEPTATETPETVAEAKPKRKRAVKKAPEAAAAETPEAVAEAAPKKKRVVKKASETAAAETPETVAEAKPKRKRAVKKTPETETEPITPDDKDTNT